MKSELDSCLQELSDVCRRLGVSASISLVPLPVAISTRKAVISTSLFSLPHLENLGYADRYLDLAEQLEKLFARPVDLMTERSLRNPILKQVISGDRRTLYAT